MNVAVACATAVVTYLALDRAMSRDSTSQAYQTVDLMKPSTSALTAFPRTAVPKTTYQAQPMEASQYEDVSGVPAQQVGVGVVPQQPRQPSQMLQNVAMLLLAPLSVVAAALLWRKGHGGRPRMAMMSYSGTPYSSILPHTAPAKVPRTVLYGKNKNDNFIDQTFTVVADQLLKFLPTTKREKKAFMYYRDGMSAQGVGEYAEALQNYYEALKLETDPYDRSYILYNIGLIHASNGELEKALEYYYQVCGQTRPVCLFPAACATRAVPSDACSRPLSMPALVPVDQSVGR